MKKESVVATLVDCDQERGGMSELVPNKAGGRMGQLIVVGTSRKWWSLLTLAGLLTLFGLIANVSGISFDLISFKKGEETSQVIGRIQNEQKRILQNTESLKGSLLLGGTDEKRYIMSKYELGINGEILVALNNAIWELGLGNSDVAVDYVDQARRLDQDMLFEKDIACTRAVIHYHEGEFDDARIEYERYVHKVPYDHSYIGGYTLSALWAGEVGKAKSFFYSTDVQSQISSDPETVFMYGILESNVLLFEKKFAAAAMRLKRAIEFGLSEPNVSDLHINAGYCQLANIQEQMGESELAEQTLVLAVQKIREVHPLHRSVWSTAINTMLAQHALDRNEYVSAQKFLAAGKPAKDRSWPAVQKLIVAEWHSCLARLALRKNLHSKAKVACENGLKILADCDLDSSSDLTRLALAGLWCRLAHAEKDQGEARRNLDKASRILDDANRSHPLLDSWRCRLQARICLRRGDLLLNEQDDESADSQFKLALNALRSVGSNADCCRGLRAEIHNSLAVVNYRAGDFDMATVESKKALELIHSEGSAQDNRVHAVAHLVNAYAEFFGSESKVSGVSDLTSTISYYDAHLCDCYHYLGGQGIGLAYALRSVAYERLGKTQEATDDALIAIQRFEAGEDIGVPQIVLNNASFRLAHEDDLQSRRLAIEYALKACELTDWKNASMIDTLAHAFACIGDTANAGVLQRKAIAISNGQQQLEFRKRLVKIEASGIGNL